MGQSAEGTQPCPLGVPWAAPLLSEPEKGEVPGTLATGSSPMKQALFPGRSVSEQP